MGDFEEKLSPRRHEAQWLEIHDAALLFEAASPLRSGVPDQQHATKLGSRLEALREVGFGTTLCTMAWTSRPTR